MLYNKEIKFLFFMITPKFAAPTLSLHVVLKKNVNEYFQQKNFHLQEIINCTLKLVSS